MTSSSSSTGGSGGTGGTACVPVDDNNPCTSVLLSQGNGTFAPAVNYDVGSGPQSIAAADLNGDGKSDLAVANHDDNAVSVLLNTCLL